MATPEPLAKLGLSDLLSARGHGSVGTESQQQAALIHYMEETINNIKHLCHLYHKFALMARRLDRGTNCSGCDKFAGQKRLQGSNQDDIKT